MFLAIGFEAQSKSMLIGYLFWIFAREIGKDDRITEEKIDEVMR